jgi:hypothetical protein
MSAPPNVGLDFLLHRGGRVASLVVPATTFIRKSQFLSDHGLTGSNPPWTKERRLAA